jgi:hypothetical protein
MLKKGYKAVEKGKLTGLNLNTITKVKIPDVCINLRVQY